MRGIVGEIEKERQIGRFGTMGTEIVAGPFGKKIGRMPRRIDLLLIFPHVVNAVTPMIPEIIHHIAEKTMKKQKPTRVWNVGTIQTQVPLSHQSRLIPGLGQTSGEQLNLRIEVAPGVPGMRPNDPGDPDLVRVTAGQQ